MAAAAPPAEVAPADKTVKDIKEGFKPGTTDRLGSAIYDDIRSDLAGAGPDSQRYKDYFAALNQRVRTDLQLPGLEIVGLNNDGDVVVNDNRDPNDRSQKIIGKDFVRTVHANGRTETDFKDGRREIEIPNGGKIAIAKDGTITTTGKDGSATTYKVGTDGQPTEITVERQGQPKQTWKKGEDGWYSDGVKVADSVEFDKKTGARTIKRGEDTYVDQLDGSQIHKRGDQIVDTTDAKGGRTEFTYENGKLSKVVYQPKNGEGFTAIKDAEGDGWHDPEGRPLFDKLDVDKETGTLRFKNAGLDVETQWKLDGTRTTTKPNGESVTILPDGSKHEIKIVDGKRVETTVDPTGKHSREARWKEGSDPNGPPDEIWLINEKEDGSKQYSAWKRQKDLNQWVLYNGSTVVDVAQDIKLDPATGGLIIAYKNGEVEHDDANGSGRRFGSDGSITLKMKDGTTMTRHLDGSVTTRSVDGVITHKDKAGNVLHNETGNASIDIERNEAGEPISYVYKNKLTGMTEKFTWDAASREWKHVSYPEKRPTEAKPQPNVQRVEISADGRSIQYKAGIGTHTLTLTPDVV